MIVDEMHEEVEERAAEKRDMNEEKEKKKEIEKGRGFKMKRMRKREPRRGKEGWCSFGKLAHCTRANGAHSDECAPSTADQHSLRI